MLSSLIRLANGVGMMILTYILLFVCPKVSLLGIVGIIVFGLFGAAAEELLCEQEEINWFVFILILIFWAWSFAANTTIMIG